MKSSTAPVWLRALGSLRLTTALLGCIFLLVLAGTLIQTRDGLWASQRMVFENWLGGMPLFCSLAALNLVAAFLVRFRWRWRNAGLLTMHLGLVALLLSGALGLAFSRTSNLDLGTLEPANAGQIPSKWEIVFQAPSAPGATQVAHPLDRLLPGALIELAPGAGTAKVLAVMANGSVGANQRPIPRPRAKEPEANIPALALEIRASGHPPQTVALGANRPFATFGNAGAFAALQRARHPLPFSIQLLEFKHETHPGSTRAKAFQSRVRIADAHGSREALIAMNHPLRLGRFTLYQSSWRTDEQSGAERSILSVTENPIGKLPYYATLLIALGMAVHFLPRLRRAPKTALLLALLALAGRSQAQALPQPPPSLLALPIQIDGRVKTFETFASHTLLEISGRERVGDLDAPQWLAAVLLDPNSVRDLPVFLIQHPDTRDALGLSGKDRDRYSWNRLMPLGLKINALASQASTKENGERTALDRDLLHLSDAWVRYSSLANAFAFLREGSVAAFPGGIPPARTFLELASRSESFASVLDSLTKIPEAGRTPADNEVLDWFRETFAKSRMWEGSVFPVLPRRDSTALPWESPASVMLARGLSRPDFRTTALEWDSLARAWKAGDALSMEASARALRDTSLARAGSSLRPAALAAESAYNDLRPFRWAMVLFWLSLAPALWGTWKDRPAALQASATLSLVALCLVGIGMALRMVITQRPPVTNLYETFLFVDAVTVPVLLAVSWARRWPAGTVLASLSGAGLLMLAQSFGADGDTMPVLVAVLDSNFWLTIHVLTITVGYAGVVAAGAAAHWHLLMLRRGEQDGSEIVRGLMAFGLFFTFVGTLLGGVWADQSWGRFWGWDPKENGALMIALWAAILFHARACGQVGVRGFSVGSVLSIPTVLFAWFGVNQLGVGLHSYGFTQGTLWGLGTYAVLETLFLAWVLRRPKAV